MRLVVHLLEPILGDVRVNPCRRERYVAEQLLDGEEVGAGIETVRGAGGAGGGGGGAGGVRDTVREAASDVLDLAGGRTAAARGQEERLAVASRDALEELAAAGLVAAQGGDGRRADRHDALLA